MAEQTTGLRIDEMFAFVAVDEADDNEGIIAFFDPIRDSWVPMVGADMEMVDALRAMAQLTATETGRTVRLVHFTERTEMEVLLP